MPIRSAIVNVTDLRRSIAFYTGFLDIEESLAGSLPVELFERLEQLLPPGIAGWTSQPSTSTDRQGDFS